MRLYLLCWILFNYYEIMIRELFIIFVFEKKEDFCSCDCVGNISYYLYDVIIFILSIC